MYANGYKYWLAYKKGTSGYYRCCRYKSNCPGRCVVDEDGVIRNTTTHNHPPEADRVIVDRFRKVLTQRAAQENTDLHVIYLEEATNRHSDASLLYTFSQAESCMRKARRKQHPQEPCSVAELKETLERSDLFRIHNGSHRDDFYQKTIVLEDTTCLILWHYRTIETVGSVEELYVECSLEIAAHSTSRYHLLVGIAAHQHNCTPVFYSIMTGKSHAGFAAIFAYVRENVGSRISPTTILTEPDNEMHNALEITYPEATIKVYWHHYTTAVLNRMRQLGLSRETARGHASSGLRMLLVLPLLPANYMTPGLEALKKWMNEKNIFSHNFCCLCDYVEQSWLGALGAKKLSLFGQQHSLSCHVKTFMKDLNNQADLQQNITVWRMLETLTQIATKQFVKLSKRNKRTVVSEKSLKSKRKLQYVQETVISNATQLWIKTAVHLRNPLQFLQLCSHCINDAMIMESLPVPTNNGTTKKVPSSIVEPTPISEYICNFDPPMVNPEPIRHITLTASDPPPLAFFPRVAVKRTEVNNASQISYNQMEPPPLVPFCSGLDNRILANIETQQPPD
ncbi:uncharacterized protein LOC131683909 [Topomyia yanbarensis]|uniref:uncharacterized protein LOC131683909 n=1 Tax=Topomyia yanbarensis TaxID=2498891 RepID=UPI00273BCB70|nr:uncharacterized protein LOC131683909 [Topomyia yanbarensis]